MYTDYKGANKEYRDKFLIKDSLILYGAASGILLSYGIGHKLAKLPQYQNIITKLSQKVNELSSNQKIKTSISYTKDILKEVISGLTTATFGIIGALGADFLLSKTKFQQPIQNEKQETQSNQELKIVKLENKLNSQLEKLTNEETVDIFYSSMIEIPKFKYAGMGMVGMDAIEIAKNKELEDKLKHTAGYLINDTLVPLLFLSTATALTQNLKTRYRIPVIFTTLFGGTLATHKIFDKLTHNQTSNKQQ